MIDTVCPCFRSFLLTLVDSHSQAVAPTSPLYTPGMSNDLSEAGQSPHSPDSFSHPQSTMAQVRVGLVRTEHEVEFTSLMAQESVAPPLMLCACGKTTMVTMDASMEVGYWSAEEGQI